MVNYTLMRRVHKPSLQAFLIGAVTGTIFTLLFVSFQDWSIPALSFKSTKYEIKDVPIGHHSHTDHHHKMINNSLANSLYNEVKVLCWILTGPQNHESKAKHVKATWGRRCNTLIFMSTVQDDDLPSVALPVIEDRDNLWGKTKQAFKYVYEHYYDQADWFFKADDDTYAVMENMRYLLHYHNASTPIYFGFRFKPYVKQGYMSGGGGYVLSKESVRRFVTEALPDPTKCKETNTGAEDVEIGKCLENVGVVAGDSRDRENRSRFLPLFATDLLIPGNMDSSHWFWQYHYYPFQSGMECCSDNLITVHYVNPHQLYLLEFLIYHVQPFGISYNPTLEEKSIKGNGSNWEDFE